MEYRAVVAGVPRRAGAGADALTVSAWTSRGRRDIYREVKFLQNADIFTPGCAGEHKQASQSSPPPTPHTWTEPGRDTRPAEEPCRAPGHGLSFSETIMQLYILRSLQAVLTYCTS